MTQSLIRLDKVSVTYRRHDGAQIQALREVNLGIQHHEFVAVMGESGSGKTTLANVIGLLMRPTSGKYVIGTREVQDLSEDQRGFIRSECVGFIFQDYALIEHLTAIENVALALQYDRVGHAEAIGRARQELEKLGLGDRISNYPSQLSGGQKQRVAIARALVKKPKLILADEPAGALDSQSRYEVLGILQDLNQDGVSIIMVTHSEEDARVAGRLIRLESGQLVKDGTQKRRIRFYRTGRESRQGAPAGQIGIALQIAAGVQSLGALENVVAQVPDANNLSALILSAKSILDANVTRFTELVRPLAMKTSGADRVRIVQALIEAVGNRRLSEIETLLADLIASVDGSESLESLIEVISESKKSRIWMLDLQACLSDPNSRVRAAAAKMVPLLDDGETVARLVSTLARDSDTRVVANFVESAINENRYDLIEPFRKTDTSWPPRVRALLAGVETLDGPTGRKSGANVLLQLLQSGDPPSMMAAAFAIGKFSLRELEVALERSLGAHPESPKIAMDLIRVFDRGRRSADMRDA